MTITFGYLVSSFILSKLDCRIVNIIFLILNSLSMMVMGLSFMFPSLTSLSIPCLVFSGLCYGLGVGPVSFVLMSSLYPQKMKSAGVAVSQTCRALIVLIQLKVSVQILPRSPLSFLSSSSGHGFSPTITYVYELWAWAFMRQNSVAWIKMKKATWENDWLPIVYL